jgi:hypothetical protein
MIRTSSIVLAAIIAATSSWGVDDSLIADVNPFRKSKVGDWIKYNVTSTSSDTPIKLLPDGRVAPTKDANPVVTIELYEVKYTVTEKSDSNVIVEKVTTIKEKETRKRYVVKLSKSYHGLEDPDDDGEKIYGDPKVLKMGKDIIMFKGKALKTFFTKTESPPWPGVYQEWESSEIPLHGLVRTEAVTTSGSYTYKVVSELNDYGFAK